MAVLANNKLTVSLLAIIFLLIGVIITLGMKNYAYWQAFQMDFGEIKLNTYSKEAIVGSAFHFIQTDNRPHYYNYIMDRYTPVHQFWLSLDDKLINLTGDVSVQLAIPCSPITCKIIKDIKEVPSVKRVYELVYNTFKNNDKFKENKKNSTILTLPGSPPRRLSIKAFELADKDIKCSLIGPYEDLQPGWQNYIFLAVACSDSFEKDYKEQIDFIRDLGLDKTKFVSIRNIVGNYAMVGTPGSNLLIKEGGKWKIISGMVDHPSCEVINRYKVPKELVENCYSSALDNVIDNLN